LCFFLGTKSIKNTEAQSVGGKTMRPQEAGMPTKDNHDPYEPQEAEMLSKDNHDTYSQGARPKETSGIQLTCVVLLLEKKTPSFWLYDLFFLSCF
jgi:hypothetical protein